MDSSITAALIAAASGLCGVLVKIAYEQWHDSKTWALAQPARFSALRGQWDGNGEDTWIETGGPPLIFRMQAEISGGGRRIKGRGNIGTPDTPSIDLRLAGGFYNDDLLQLNYSAKDSRRKQAGVAMLRLSPNGRELTGRYIGFSPERGCLVQGTLHLIHQS